MARYGISGRPWCTHCGAYVDRVDDHDMCDRCIEVGVRCDVTSAEAALEMVSVAVEAAFQWAHAEDILGRVGSMVDDQLAKRPEQGPRLEELYEQWRAHTDARVDASVDGELDALLRGEGGQG